VNGTLAETYTKTLVAALIALGQDETTVREALSISFAGAVRLFGTTTTLTTTTLLLDYIVGWVEMQLPGGLSNSAVESASTDALVALYGIDFEDLIVESTQVDTTSWSVVFQVPVESGTVESDELYEDVKNKTKDDLRSNLIDVLEVPALLTNLNLPDLTAATVVTSLVVDRFQPTTTTTTTPPVDYVVGTIEIGLPDHTSEFNATQAARWMFEQLFGTQAELSVYLEAGNETGNWTIMYTYHVYSDDAQEMVWSIQNTTSEDVRQLLVDALLGQGEDAEVADEEVWVGAMTVEWFPATQTSTTTTTTTTRGPDELEVSDFLPFIVMAGTGVVAVLATVLIGVFLLKSKASIIPARNSAFAAAIQTAPPGPEAPAERLLNGADQAESGAQRFQFGNLDGNLEEPELDE